MQQQRYFIGITLPADLSESIANIQHDLHTPQAMLLALAPHITLIEPNLLSMLPPDDFIPEVKKLANQFLPLSITLTQTNCFGRNVFYVAVSSEELVSLQKALMELVSKATYGLMQPNRLFQPHVTIAQAKHGYSLPTSLVEGFKNQVNPLLPQSFTVEELAYFQWIHPRTYALYEI